MIDTWQLECEGLSTLKLPREAHFGIFQVDVFQSSSGGEVLRFSSNFKVKTGFFSYFLPNSSFGIVFTRVFGRF